MKKTILALALSLSLAAGSAQADTISFNFSGHWGSVASSTAALNLWFPLGGAFSGKIEYQSDATPIANSDGSFSYLGGEMTFGNLNWQCTVATPELNIFNGTIDQFVVHFTHLGSSVLFVPTGEFRGRTGFAPLPVFLGGEFSLKDDQGLAFSSTSLPSSGIMNLWPMPFDYGMLNLYFLTNPAPSLLRAFSTSQESYPTVSGSIDTHPTPEPTTFLLFTTGLTGLAAYRRRRAN